MDLDAYRERSLATWNEIASGWDEERRFMWAATRPVSEWLVEHASPQPGNTLLELACGTGDTGFLVAEAVGREGRVVMTDFSEGMLEAAQREAERRGIENVEFRRLDAEKMDLDDSSFDGVICRWGYMLMADPAAALKETRRVLRDGGPLAFAVWRTPDRNPWAAVPGMTLVQRGHMPAPEPGAPGIFALGEPDRIRELVTAAGFGEPELEEIAFEFRYADFDDLWDALVRIAGPLARVVNALPDDERQATRAAIEENVAPYRNAEGSYTAPAATWGVLVR